MKGAGRCHDQVVASPVSSSTLGMSDVTLAGLSGSTLVPPGVVGGVDALLRLSLFERPMIFGISQFCCKSISVGHPILPFKFFITALILYLPPAHPLLRKLALAVCKTPNLVICGITHELPVARVLHKSIKLIDSSRRASRKRSSRYVGAA